MKKTIILVLLSILIGVLLSIFLFKQYDKDGDFYLVSTDAIKYYFVGILTYSSYDEMIDNTKNIEEFIYTNDDENYYVFGCITKSYEYLDKIEGYFKDMGYITYRKVFNLSSKNLNREVTSTDLLLSDEIDNINIKKLCSQTIKIYKEG